ncbi:hypothetical protein RSP795_10140 [Ralstonia solanacearum]|uniref:hypothetical protein n=1 Tax=Ralstonia solanacearum TaxID=305 RepID=UPI0007D807D3|nr:hypothetical protein [Ralstonia solanacearum]OAI62793.1 hypothetical protein RSP795_10140 [Ralstonia solanacearum]
MIVFENGIDVRCREAKTPTAAKFHMGDGTYRYVVIGTEYGFIHTTAGDVRTWGSRSGAGKAATNYVGL